MQSSIALLTLLVAVVAAVPANIKRAEIIGRTNGDVGSDAVIILRTGSSAYEEDVNAADAAEVLGEKVKIKV